MSSTKYEKAPIKEEDFQGRTGGKKRWADKEGKRYVCEVGIALSIISLVCVFLAFVSPYWIVSWPRVHSGFKRIGLWEVCFSGLVLDLDPNQKAYHGCWWILAPEFKAIRVWLFPGWFVCAQFTVTISMCAQVINLGIVFLTYCTSGGCDPETSQENRNRKQPNVKLLATSFIITCVCGFLLSATAIFFAISFYFDLGWLPMHYLNYLSWGYGMLLVAAVTQDLAALAQGSYFWMVRKDMRQPPKDISFLQLEKREPKMDYSYGGS